MHGFEPNPFGSHFVAGVDEVGRGPLAGPVVTAAVILACPVAGLADSKQLTARRRSELAAAIREAAVAIALGRAEVAEIDELNILRATQLAMSRAVDALPSPPQAVLVDGNIVPYGAVPWLAVVGGDGRIPAVSAASILAKVARDQEMRDIAERYPQYGFEQHKGYATPGHLRVIERIGPCPMHRRSFAPLREAHEVTGQTELMFEAP